MAFDVLHLGLASVTCRRSLWMASSFHAEFHRIQQALKKGLFKKVDHGASAEELLELGGALRREGNAPHAALCLMAAAQCLRVLEQPTVAAHHEVQAGQLLCQEQLQRARKNSQKSP